MRHKIHASVVNAIQWPRPVPLAHTLGQRPERLPTVVSRYFPEKKLLYIFLSSRRDKANFTYSTIAITAALLAAVTFSAYITPPSPPTFAVPANTTSVWDNREVAIQNAILETFYTIRTISARPYQHNTPSSSATTLLRPTNCQCRARLTACKPFHAFPAVVPINFLMNLLSTLTACLVMVYVNSSRTSEEELVKMFGDPCAPHLKAAVTQRLTTQRSAVLCMRLTLPS